jgi:hypothetical protein
LLKLISGFKIRMATMTFQFVENSKIDGNARKAIRSHVMKGKNVGKIRTQSTRMDLQTLCSTKTIAPKLVLHDEPSQNAYCDETTIFSIPRTPGSTISSFSFPGEVQPYGSMEKLIYQCRDDIIIIEVNTANQLVQSWQ